MKLPNIKATLLICALIVQATFLTAQIDKNPVFDYSSPGQFTVGGVEIVGAENRDRNAIKSITGLREGETIEIPGDDIPNAIKALWRLRLFEDVQINQTKLEEGNIIFLEIVIKERPTLSRYTFRGTKKLYHDDLNEALEDVITKGSIVTGDMKDLASIKIKEYFIEKGFLETDVNIIEELDEATDNGVKLIFEIAKNERLKIARIDFFENKYATDAKLRRKMKNIKRKNTVYKKSRFIKKEYKEDKAAVLNYYRTLGYRDAVFTKDSMYTNIAGELMLELTIDEGQQYTFGDISWQGNTIYTDEQLSTILGIKKGELFNPEQLEKRLRFSLDGRDVSSLYLDDGYLFFDIQPTEVAVHPDRSIDMRMAIYEGPQATIEDVIIKGNDRTHEHVIRRAVRTRPGEKFSRSDIIRSQRELTNLGYFNPETMDIQPKVNAERGTVDIEYNLEERPSDQLELSAGYGGVSNLIGTLGMTFNNFSVKNFKDRSTWSPLPQGDGQRLSLRAQSNGQLFRSINASFTEPWLGGKKPNSFTAGIVFSGYDYSRFDQGKLGIWRGFVGLGSQLKWPDDYFSSSSTLTVERISLEEYRASISNFRVVQNNDLVDINTGTFWNVSLRQVISRSTILQPLYPRGGSRMSLAAQFTLPYSSFREQGFTPLTDEECREIIEQKRLERGSGYDPTEADIRTWKNQAEAARKFRLLEYHKWRFDAEWYYNIVDKLVFATSAKVGILGFYDKQIGFSPFERFELGGDGLNNQQVGITGKDIIKLRGYNDENDFLINDEGGATIFNKYSMELRYPISLNPSSTIYGLVFVEGGNSFLGFKNYNPFDLKRSVGGGLRVFLPMFGLLGFDYGWGFDKDRNSESFGEFQIIIGFEPD